MGNFFTEYGGTAANVSSFIPGPWGSLAQQGLGFFTQQQSAKDQAKLQAQQAAREFELEKLRVQALANQPPVMPGAPSETAGGTGLARGVPTWALAGAGIALLLVLMVRRR